MAVLSSINNRVRFWEEFGWSRHYQKFIQELEKEESAAARGWLLLEKELRSTNEQIIFMWTASQEIGLSQVKAASGYVVCYEDLYIKPFVETKRILTYLGYKNRTIHPSYLFEPSLTTHRTFHNSSTGLLAAPKQLPQIFWKSSIKKEEEEHLLELIRKMKPKSPEVLRYLKED